MKVSDLTAKIIGGALIDRDEARFLLSAPLEDLRVSAKAITSHFFKEKVELCCISNGKCGNCTENCKFCSQSRRFDTKIGQSRLKSVEEFFAEAKYNSDRGVHRFSIVTSGLRLPPSEVKAVGEAYKKISSELKIRCCGSLGLLSYDELVYLKSCGLTRFHNNLETSRRFFPQICTTHSYDQKLETLRSAHQAGLEVCSGCIIGMGETFEDRLDIAFTLREVGTVSTPINILNPIKGTPLEDRPVLGEEEIERTVALFRHILPRTVLRTAGGRLLIKKFYKKLFDFGINAEITGDMLTTQGLTIAQDISDAIALNKEVTRIDAPVM
ncbi:MAG: biotin synthase BioB [Succinivibrio sp.]|jgi:biotin synthase|nr:biotin synthase BioB [Succinivibrio sp.]